MLERQQEFPYEGHRWFDLVRMGGAKEAMKAEGHTIQDFQFLYPIPKTELERINKYRVVVAESGILIWLNLKNSDDEKII